MKTSPDILDRIRTQGARAYPEEGCGFLLGRVTEEGVNHVSDLAPVANRQTENRERRYQITADDYRAAEVEADRQGLDIVGFYHSHPDHPAHPSDTDLEEATFPGYTYVIVSVHEGTPEDLTAWSLTPDRSRFEAEDVATPDTV